jgi:endonuclease VIII
MPEGNEIHRWAERHNAAFAGRKMNVAPGPNMRFADAQLLDGKKLRKVHAVGKHLGYEFGDDLMLHVHLGRFGDFTEGVGPLAEPKGALRLVMQRAGRRARGAKAQPQNLKYVKDDGTQPFPPEDVDWLELRGPSDCSVYDGAKWKKLLERLGPDPLNGDDPAPAFEKILKSDAQIGALLMQQEVLSGIGNIFRAEMLFRARMSPFVQGHDVPEPMLRTLWRDAKKLLREGMVDRRIVTTQAMDRPHGKGMALAEEAHYVYRRAGKECRVCGTKVMKKEFVGRTLYWCPLCQGSS